MINEDKDSSLIISIKSPSNILSAVLDCQANYNLQLKKCKKLLGTRVELNDPMCTNEKSFTILGGGQGVLSKRTEDMLLKNKSEGSRNGRNSPLFEQKVSNVRSADKFIKNAAKNHYSFENGLKYTETVLGIFSLPFSKMTLMISSTGGGDSSGLTVVYGEKVDSKALDICNYLQLNILGRTVIFEVLGMLHSICRICRLRYSNGAADLLVVTCLHATARIILLIIMLYAVVCCFYINCISVLLPVTPCYCITRRSTVSDSLLRIVASETDGAVIPLARYPYGTSLVLESYRRLRARY